MDNLNYLSFIHHKVPAKKKRSQAQYLEDIIQTFQKKKENKIDLSGLNLIQVPDIIFGFHHLKTIDLSNNHLEMIPDGIAKLKNLRTLVVRNNGLIKVPDLSELESLKKLFLGGNNFASLDQLSLPASLEELHLSRCGFESIPSGIFVLKHLKLLWLNHNKIKEVPSEISGLSSLKTCYLQQNKLNKLPAEMFELPQLEGVYVEENPMQEVPIYNWEGNHYKDLKTYYQSLGESEIINYKGKIVLLGKGEVGKTTLAKRLQNPQNSAEITEPTKGIEIFPLENIPVGKEEEDQYFELKIWDFGGQEIQHNIHHFFLTDNALYLLLWTARSEEHKYSYFKR